MQSKNLLRRQINRQRDYVYDLIDQITNQKPQPNGWIWLYGEVITRSRFLRAVRELNQEIDQYNSIGKKRLCHLTYNREQLINKHTGRLFIRFNNNGNLHHHDQAIGSSTMSYA